MPNDRPTFTGDPFGIVQYLDGANKGVGDWVANGTPTTPIGQAIQSGFRKQCDLYSRAPSWVQQASAGALISAEDTCRPWLESQGSGGPVPGNPEFQGGQCVGYLYTVTWRLLRPDGSTRSQGSNGRVGPLGPLIKRPVGGGSDAISFEQAQNVGQPNEEVIPFVIGFPGDNFQFLSVVPAGGQVDNCGNLPSGPTANPNARPDPNLPPDEQPYLDPDGRPVFPMPKIPNPFGDPLPLPNIKLPNFFDKYPLGDGEVNDTNEDPGIPGSPTETGQGGQAEGGDSSSELVGVLIELIEAREFVRRIEKPFGDVYIGPAYVLLGVDGRLDLQEEGRSMVFPQFFYAPQPATHWKVLANPGYNLSVTPYYRAKANG